MWNFAFRPLYTDDVVARGVEIVSHAAGSTDPIEHFSIGHMGFYKYVGRTEAAPVPLDKDVLNTGIVYRAGAYPILDPRTGTSRSRLSRAQRNHSAAGFSLLLGAAKHVH
jgi:hypothetical protein